MTQRRSSSAAGPASLSSDERRREGVLSVGDAWDSVVLKHLIRPVFTGCGASAPAPASSQRCEMPSSGKREEAETQTGSIILAAILDAWGVFTQTPEMLISFSELNVFYFEDMSELAPGKSLQNIA